MVGTTQGYQPGRVGFFVAPADPHSNTERCFVIAAATTAGRLRLDRRPGLPRCRSASGSTASAASVAPSSASPTSAPSSTSSSPRSTTSPTPAQVARLLAHDTVHGRFPVPVEAGRRPAPDRRPGDPLAPRDRAGGDRLARRRRRDGGRGDRPLPAARSRGRAPRRLGAPGDRLRDRGRRRRHLLPRRQRGRFRPRPPPRGLERLLHHQLPGGGARRAPSGLRRRARADEHGALRHQQPEPGRHGAPRSAPRALGGRQHHSRPPRTPSPRSSG